MKKSKTIISDNLMPQNACWQYDEHAKNLLADKEILAYILKYATDEFRNMPIKDIIPCIEGTPEIGGVPVSPGLTNTSKITGETTEDTIPGEGYITFDIRTSATTKKRIKIIIDIEAQKSITLKYPIEKRMVFYLARMISSQKNREFIGDDYTNIKKVYSIWICMNVDEKNKRDSITKFSFSCENIVGNYVSKKNNYDLMTGILICVSNDMSENYVEDNIIPEDERKLIRLLKTLFSNKLSQKEKKESLQNDYHIQINETIDKELMEMCNLGYGVFEQGLKRGDIRRLFNQVLTKYLKGKSCLQIADELETDLSIVEQIYELLEHTGTDVSESELVDILVEKNIL